MKRKKYTDEFDGKEVGGRAKIFHLDSLSLKSSILSCSDDQGLSKNDYALLIESVYEGIRDEVPWSGMIELLRGILEANYVTLVLRNPSQDRRLQVIFSGEEKLSIATEYESRYHEMDPFVNMPRDRVVTVDDLVGDARFLATPFYQDFHRHLDIRYLMGADIGDCYEPICGLRFSRSHDSVPFGDKEKSICSMLLPHLRTAVELRLKMEMLEVEKDFYAGMLEKLAVGAVLLDTRGRVIKVNRVAGEILGENDGLSIFQNTLMAAFSKENRVLRTLLENAVLEGSASSVSDVKGLSVTRPSGRPGLGVVVHPAPQNKWLQSEYKPAALVIIRDAARKNLISEAQLRLLYGLTRAEASLVLQLMEGWALEEAAQNLHITRNTARCQLRSVFSKVGVARQSELLRVLLNGVALLG